MKHGKHLGLKGAHDYGAGMRKNAEAQMQDVMGLGAPPGAGAMTSPIQGPAMPPGPGAMPPNGPGGMKRGGTMSKYAKGGKVAEVGRKLTSQETSKSGGFNVEKGKPGAHGKKENRAYGLGGGVSGVRKGGATDLGLPKAPGAPIAPPKPKVKFKGTSGIKGC